LIQSRNLRINKNGKNQAKLNVAVEDLERVQKLLVFLNRKIEL